MKLENPPPPPFKQLKNVDNIAQVQNVSSKNEFNGTETRLRLTLIRKEVSQGNNPESVHHPNASNNLFLRKINHKLKFVDTKGDLCLNENEVDSSGDVINNFEDSMDDLTNLSWLQDTNLLKNIQKSQTSIKVKRNQYRNFRELTNYLINGQKLVGEQNQPNNNNSSWSVFNCPNPTHFRQCAMNNNENKPPYSFSVMIFMAISNSPSKKLAVKDIYDWICEKFPYFRNANSGWKNSVRHNLSLNKCFKKVDKDSKGSYWYIDPFYRPLLLKTLKKLPYHPFSRIQMVTSGEYSLFDHRQKDDDEEEEEEEDYDDCDSSDITDRVEYDAASTLVHLSKMSGRKDDELEGMSAHDDGFVEHSYNHLVESDENVYGVEVKESSPVKFLTQFEQNSTKNIKIGRSKILLSRKIDKKLTCLIKKKNINKPSTECNLDINNQNDINSKSIHNQLSNKKFNYSYTNNITDTSTNFTSAINTNKSNLITSTVAINRSTSDASSTSILNPNNAKTITDEGYSGCFPMLAKVVQEEQKKMEGIEALLGLANEITIKSC